MNKALFLLLSSFSLFAEPAPGSLLFTPPENWKETSKDELPKNVQFMVVGKSEKDFPPSINLGVEPYPGSSKDYIKLIKRINQADRFPVQELGSVKTQAGTLHLIQVDINGEWGPVRLLHAVLTHDRTLYLLTAAALKSEFNQHIKEFISALKSVEFTADLYSRLESPHLFKKRVNSLFKRHEEILKTHLFRSRMEAFASAPFQEEVWKPFTEELSDLDVELKEALLKKISSQLSVQYE